MNKIGFHVMNSKGANSGWVERFKPAVCLSLAIGVNGEVPQLLQLCQANPNTHFIYRAWRVFSPGDSDHFEWYFKEFGTDPLPFIQAHEPTIRAIQQYGVANRVSIQAFNETGHDEHIFGAFIDFNARYVKEMDRRGLSASVFGFGPGHPAWNSGADARENIRRSWFAARPLFEAINAAREMHIINLHEYHALPWRRFEPWVIGRYRWMLQDVQLMGLPINKLKVVIGESGFTDPNALGYPSPSGPNGYLWSLAQGYSPQQLAEDYAEMVKIVYNPSPNLLGLCYYGLGSEPGWWEDFDLLKEPGILQRLEQLLVHGEQPVIVETEDIKFEVLVGGLRVRDLPSRGGAVLRGATLGEVFVTNAYTDADNHRWRRLVTGEWVAEYYTGAAEPYMTEVLDTKKALLAQLAHMQLELDVLKAMVVAL